MNTQHKFLVAAFIILASTTLLASIVERDKTKGILSEIRMSTNNKVVLRLVGDSSSYYVSRSNDMINISQYNSKYIGKILEIEYNKPLFFDTNEYPVLSLKKENTVLFSLE